MLLVAFGCSGTDLSADSKAGRNLELIGGQTNGGAVSTTGSNTSSGSSTLGGSLANGGGTAVTGGASGNTVPTWTQLYSSYFGPGTSGSCASCHASGNAPTINSAATLCVALKNSGYILNGSATLQNLLTWFGGSGNMPLGGGAGPANAVSDITAWQNAGAVCP